MTRLSSYETSMEYHQIRMIRRDLESLPYWPLPEGFSIRWYRPGDVEAWVRIHKEADFYNESTPGLYQEAFGNDETLLAKRQAFLCYDSGRQIGTAGAWFDDDYHGERFGRVHWVAIEPQYQGRGLSKPLASEICRRLVELGHERAYLTTATVRIPAINLYLQFGFEPDIRSDEDERAWSAIRGQLKR